MKTRILALALALILLLTACATHPAETTAPATTAPAETTQPVETTAAPPETTAPPAALIRYPLEVDAAYADLAQELPDHIYTTKGSENGLAGTIYAFEGTVADYSTTEIEGTGVEQVFVETDGGTVMVANFYKWLYNSARNAYGKAAADSAYPYPLGGYRLPGIGETAPLWRSTSDTPKPPKRPRSTSVPTPPCTRRLTARIPRRNPLEQKTTLICPACTRLDPIFRPENTALLQLAAADTPVSLKIQTRATLSRMSFSSTHGSQRFPMASTSKPAGARLSWPQMWF